MCYLFIDILPFPKSSLNVYLHFFLQLQMGCYTKYKMSFLVLILDIYYLQSDHINMRYLVFVSDSCSVNLAE